MRPSPWMYSCRRDGEEMTRMNRRADETSSLTRSKSYGKTLLQSLTGRHAFRDDTKRGRRGVVHGQTRFGEGFVETAGWGSKDTSFRDEIPRLRSE